MKKKVRRIILTGALAALALLSACSGKTSPEPEQKELYIEQAVLSDEEQKLQELLGLGKHHWIYDFSLDDTVKSVQLNTYELQDGHWLRIAGGGGQAFTGPDGRIALSSQKIKEGLRVAVQGADGTSVTTYFTGNETEEAAMGSAASRLSGRQTVVYEEEIPLAIQIVTSKREIHSYMVEYFFEPERYEPYDYEHVYAITVRFSQKEVKGLEEAETKAE